MLICTPLSARCVQDGDKRRFTLPRATMEGLRKMAIDLAVEQRSAGWPREAARYPRTLNYFVTAACNDFLAKMGYGQFCVEEIEPIAGGIRRFVAR